MAVIDKIYPGYELIGIDQLFVPRVGWYSVLVDDEGEAWKIIRAGVDAAGRRIEMFAIVLRDKEGFRRIAEFRKEELI